MSDFQQLQIDKSAIQRQVNEATMTVKRETEILQSQLEAVKTEKTYSGLIPPEYLIAQPVSKETKKQQEEQQPIKMQKQENKKLNTRLHVNVALAHASYASPGAPVQQQKESKKESWKERRQKNREREEERVSRTRKAADALGEKYASEEAYIAHETITQMEQQRMNANKELGEMTQRENISTDKVDLRLYRLFGEGYDVNDQGEPNAPIDEFKKMRHETFKEDYLSGDIERRAPYIQKFCDEIMAFPVTNELFDEKYIMTHIREIKTICDRACYFQNIQDIDTRNKEFFEGMSPEEKRALSEKLDFLASYGCYFQGFIGRLGVDSNTGMYKDPDELDTGYDARSEKDFKGIAQRRLNILKVANAGDENERLGRELITKKLREYFPKASDNEIQGRMGNMYYRYGMLMRPGDFGNRNSDIAELAVKSYRMNGTNDSGERAELEKEQARLAAKVVNEYMDTYSKKIEGQIPKYVSMSDQDLMNHYEELAEYGRSLEQVSYGRSLEQVSPWKPKTAIYGSSWSRMSNIGNIKANPGTDDGMTVEQKYANTHEGFDLRSYSVGNNIMGSLAKKARFLIYKDAVINRIDPMSDALGPLLDGTDGRSYIDSIDWQEIGPELKRRAYTEERYDDSLGTVTIKTGVYDELLSRLDQIIEAETQYVNESYQAFRQEQERMQQNKK